MWRFAALAASFLMTNVLAREPAEAPAAPAAPMRVILAASDGMWPLERVYAKLRKHYSGDPLDARIVRNPPHVVLYEVQWLTHDGRKVVFIVDAHDGNIVGARGLENDANSGG